MLSATLPRAQITHSFGQRTFLFINEIALCDNYVYNLYLNINVYYHNVGL